jgi:hypothetical protein
MQDMQEYLKKLHRDAVDCALISKRATDPQKRVLFDQLADHLVSDACIGAGTSDRREGTLAAISPIATGSWRARSTFPISVQPHEIRRTEPPH